MDRSRLIGGSLVVVTLLAAILLPRLLGLDRFLTADEKRWAANTSNFLGALSHGDWDNLLQQPHPGITTQWLGAPTILSESWAERKLPLVLGQGILVGIIGYVFFRLWGWRAAALLTLLLALNPVLVAHTRVYAMDSLLAEFLLLWYGLLLLWKEFGVTRYLIGSAAAGALAVLSKLPGILVVPFSVALLGWWGIATRDRRLPRTLVIWGCAFLLTLGVVLPSLVTNTVPVLQNIAAFFRSDDYQELHRAGPFFYVSALAFSSTPLHLLALVVAIVVWVWSRLRSASKTPRLVPRSPAARRGEVGSLGGVGRIRSGQVWPGLLFALLFFGFMTLGAKKGDRYILPVFLFLDVLVVAVADWAGALDGRGGRAATARLALGAGILWEAWMLWTLHPYALAYVNPLARPFLDDRRMGWGEGLELAAEYLNAKPRPDRLVVASYYPHEFAYRFRGRVVPLHQYENGAVRYVVLYRAMFERGAGAPETEILETFRSRTPEMVVRINGIEYAWIYRQ